MSKPLLHDRSPSDFPTPPRPGKTRWKITLWIAFLIFVVMTGVELLMASEGISSEILFGIMMFGLFKYFIGAIISFWVVDNFVLPLYRQGPIGKGTTDDRQE